MTVKDLIAKLAEFPPDAVVVIDDADTNWALPINKVVVGDHHPFVVVGGDYSEAMRWDGKPA